MHKPRFFSLATGVAFLVSLLSVPHGAAQGHRTAKGHVIVEPTGPMAVFDTSSGRVVCRLYSKQAPITTANFIALAQGKKDWADASSVVQQGKPFYDGTQVFGMTVGITAGDRAAVGTGIAGPSVTPEKTGLDVDRAGRLIAMVVKGAQSSSIIGILQDADLEYSKRAVVFGQCDKDSIEVARSISHELMSTDNHPVKPVVLRRVVIVAEGQPLPAPAGPIAGEATLSVPPLPAPAVAPPEPTGPTVQIETSKGTFTCRLFSKEAPIGVANFIGLAQGTKPFKSPATHAEVRGKKFYEGLSFGRVIPDFMVQNADMPGDPEGGGSLGFKFDNEIVPGLTFDRPGRLAYANSGPGTNESEFFITEHTVHRLDGNYTIFGQCDDASVKLVEEIARVPRDAHNKPLTPVVIRHVSIESVPR
ncbi:peptidylprolyl isomerase [Granulicella paludicola]|uniref:peptidylprolyl isomerase n=1 Tax=Granulicella paludicola TaxID=474951 RepID=UPI0021E0FBDE|nr:peptidylprolyl isomerase [Granulicella paludicola]